MNGAWFQTQLTAQGPGFWLLLSLLTLPLVLLASGRISRRRRRWLYAARWILIPYVGLMVGGLSPRLMGLSKINWAITFTLGIALLFGLMLLAVGVRFFIAVYYQPAENDGRYGLGESRSGWASLGIAILMAGAEQFHWTFIRGALWEILLLWPQPLNGTPAYRAMWIATLVTLPEIWLQPLSVPQRLVKSTLLIMTAIVFFYTRNFWLAWLLHIAAWTVLTKRAPRIDVNAPAASDVN